MQTDVPEKQRIWGPKIGNELELWWEKIHTSHSYPFKEFLGRRVDNTVEIGKTRRVTSPTPLELIT